MREHSNYKRTPFTQHAVNAAGYEPVAFFDLASDAERFARWLRGVGYSPWVWDIASFDREYGLEQGRYRLLAGSSFVL